MQNETVHLQFDNDIYNTIRRNIKKYRKEKGLTAAQLAEMVDLSHDFIRQIESEKVGYNFSVETFYKISVALDVSLDKLIEPTALYCRVQNEFDKYRIRNYFYVYSDGKFL